MNLNSSLQRTPIAVIGLSAIVADAKNIEEFWSNIIEGKDSITDVPENRWKVEDYYDPDMFAPDKTYCKRGGFMPDIDFNPMEFGLPPNILEVTDASQLLGLVAARDALVDAGYGQTSAKFSKELKAKTGVLLGVGGGQKLISPLISRLQYPIWEKALRESGVAEKDIPPIVDKMKKAYVGWNENSFPGLLGNVISGRITNRFDLGGINSVVDAACAASLSAIKMAMSELVEGRCDMMLTGGVDTDNSPFMYMSFSKTPAFSKSGNISPFSNDADGMLIGEGIGMLVLKRLEDAERDGDRIYAVIKGVGTSSDGRFKSVYAPRPEGQALAMSRAYEDAGFPASTVGLIEAHGTGTGAGDPTEFTSMQMVFGANNPNKQNIALGSVKSQIGHTKAAAGAAGMVKAVLGLHHKVLPPTINVEQPNEKFDIRNSALYINTEARPWLRNSHPRRASVSAFGFGGINVHIAMEEYEGNKPRDYRLHQPFKSILLEAENPTQLQQFCQAELDKLQSNEGINEFQNLVNSSKNSVPHQTYARIGFIAKGLEECIELLQISIQNLATNHKEWSHPKGIHYRPNGIDTTSEELVALFAGQGSQYVGMGKELTNSFPEVSEAFQMTDDLFVKNGESPLSNTIFPIPAFSDEERKTQQSALTRTRVAQPAIGTLSMGQYKILSKSGFQPHFTAGHSYGELTALWAAGVYDDETFLALSKTRGAVMSTENPEADRGTMMAVEASQEVVRQAIANTPGVSIADVNSDKQIILGGSTPAIQTAHQQLKEQGFRVVLLPVSAAFHTEFVKHAQQPFADFIERQKFNRPLIPVYSNTTGNPFPEDSNALKFILEQQILKPVLFKNQIENIYKAGGRVFVEFGPKGVLTKLVNNILHDKEHIAIAVNPNPKKDSDLQFRQAVLQLRVLGLPLTNIDPYKKEMPALPAVSKMNVRLSGNNYVSEPTKKAYEEVSNNGFQISGGQTRTVEKIVEVEKVIEVEKVVEVEKIVEVQAENAFNTHTENEEMMNKEVFQLLQQTLETFKTNQTKSLEIFERFMSDQNQQANQLLQMLSTQIEGNLQKPEVGINNKPSIAPVSKPDPQPVVIPAIPDNSNGNGTQLDKVTTNPEVNKVVEAAAPSKPNSNQLEKMLLEVVSEKTGYPAEMLELGMDMEADLGIDSIKRVEIFGALTKKYPEMEGIDPTELTELRTLGEIVDHVSTKGDSLAVPQPVSTPVVTQAKATPDVVAATATTTSTTEAATLSADTGDLEKMLLEVVSEKTGYPSEMLELGMDMEADLGIDSIKRVEIFGALTRKYPEMEGIDPNELTELRTLGEIVDYVSTKGDALAVPPPASAPVAAQETASPDAVTETVDPPPTSATAIPDIDAAELANILLEVVSEKTGYPSEMLELDMDMEADLGIDSIKRVEIFGSLTKKYPEMEGIDPNELTELRTLGEIVDFVKDPTKKKVLA
jgi:polyketide-type polyunsaturated fatty acid synthase PfaA